MWLKAECIEHPMRHEVKWRFARLGARGIMVIVVGNEHGDTSSNPGRDWLHFT